LLDALQVEGRDHCGLVDDDQGAGCELRAPGCPLGRVGRIGTIGAALPVGGSEPAGGVLGVDARRLGELIGRDLGCRKAQHRATVGAPVVGKRPHRGGLTRASGTDQHVQLPGGRRHAERSGPLADAQLPTELGHDVTGGRREHGLGVGGLDQLRLGGKEPVGGPPVHPGRPVGVDHGVGDVHHLAGDVVHQAGDDLVLFGLVGAKHPVGVVAFGVQEGGGQVHPHGCFHAPGRPR
jgi:hypothetical protein